MIGCEITISKEAPVYELERAIKRAMHGIKTVLKEKKLPDSTKILEFKHKNKIFLFVLEKEDNYERAIEKFKNR